jgi:hypothetical protein
MESTVSCPSFWCSTPGQNQVRAVPCFPFSYYYSHYSSSEFSCSEIITLGLVMFSWLCFQINMDNYPHITITFAPYCPGFQRMLYDALLHLSHNGDIPVYRGRMSKAHGQDRCEVRVMLPLSPTEPWGRLSSKSSWTRRLSRQHTSPSPPFV